jgi:hypothetical protein
MEGGITTPPLNSRNQDTTKESPHNSCNSGVISTIDDFTSMEPIENEACTVVSSCPREEHTSMEPSGNEAFITILILPQ